jgi:hypothetical protein
MLHTKRRVFRTTAVTTIVAALVVTISGGATAGNHRGPSGASGEKKEWTQTGIGASIVQEDGSMLLVASVENSLDGDGAVVATITLDGNGGTNTATRYQANGVGKFEEEFTLGATDANGMIPITGTGKCVKGGTRAHKGEKCNYTYTGTLDPATNVVTFDISGTTTR